MASGIAIDEDVKPLYDDFVKGTKGQKTRRCVVFRVSDDNKKIIRDAEEFQLLKSDPKSKSEEHTSGDTESKIHELCQLLVNGTMMSNCTPRWIIFDFDFKADGVRDTNKLIMIKWCPCDSKIKSRMIFTSSTKAFTEALNISATAVQCDCIEEIKCITHELICGKLK